MTSATDDIVFLLYDFCYFDKKIFKKIPKICLETEIENKKFNGRNFRYFTLYDLFDTLSSRQKRCV